MTVVIATGGSGGHIYPALSVADALRGRGHEVRFVGGKRGMEARLVPEAGYRFDGVRTGKWDRARPSPRQALRAAWGLVEAVAALRSSGADLVIGFGGFASFPACAAAIALGRPLVLHEVNAFPGRVTRWLARYADLTILTDPAAGPRLPRARRLAEAPYPLRETRLARAEARARLGLPDEGLVTLVMGGSQGSLALNRAVPEAYRRVARPDLTVLHSSGRRWHAEVAEQVADLPGYHARPYLDATLAWSAADLAITRAGMGTLAEAAFHGVPLILIPLPSAAEDHQLHNARSFASRGAGRIVEEHRIETLDEVWREMIDDETRTRAAAAARAIAPGGGGDAVADLLDEVVGRRRAEGPA